LVNVQLTKTIKDRTIEENKAESILLFQSEFMYALIFYSNLASQGSIYLQKEKTTRSYNARDFLFSIQQMKYGMSKHILNKNQIVAFGGCAGWIAKS
jgi:hypothetical protein